MRGPLAGAYLLVTHTTCAAVLSGPSRRRWAWATYFVTLYYIGPVRLDEFERIWMNLWEENIVSDEKKKWIQSDLRAHERVIIE